MRNVLFRTDASESAGAGHLMRCIALAQYLSAQDIQITFLTRTSWKLLGDYLKSHKFATIDLECAEDELGGDKDLKLTSEIAKPFDWIVLDNYYFSSAYQYHLQ